MANIILFCFETSTMSSTIFWEMLKNYRKLLLYELTVFLSGVSEVKQSPISFQLLKSTCVQK